jgi:DNA replication protein DnaC
LRQLAAGDYLSRAETVILLGEPGTGKTHLAIALGVAAVEQGRRVRLRCGGPTRQ